MQHSGDDSSPSGLVASTKASPIVAMEVLVEQDEIAPVRVFLEFLRSSIDRAMPFAVPNKDIGQPSLEFFGHLIQVHLASRSGGTFNGEIISVVGVVLQQGADDEAVDRHPDGSAPIGIAAEHAGVGFGWQITHAILLPSG